jgi:archaellum biogenesis protein FlaJ (TadC family)
MVGLLEFIVEIMSLFSSKVRDSQQALSGSATVVGEYSVAELFTFGQVNMPLVDGLVTIVVLVLTCADAFAPKAASGGENLKTAYNLAIMMMISGGLMVGVPAAAHSIFSSILDS